MSYSNKLRNEIRCTIKFCKHLGKADTETVNLLVDSMVDCLFMALVHQDKLRKKAYKDKCFDASMVFRCHGDF